VVRQTLSLHPFHPVQQWQIAVECVLARKNDALQLTYSLVGELEGVVLPLNLEESTGQRLDGLWQSTCFECFFTAGTGSGYHELNLSPRGDWNLYAFDSYRSGMREEARVASLQLASRYVPGACVVETCLDLEGLGLSNSSLSLGLSAVLAHPDGSLSYWALCHPEIQPDFHDNSAFIVSM